MKQYNNLIHLSETDPDFLIELLYPTENNFTGSKVYPSKECYMDINTAKRLIKTKDIVQSWGYRMKVWDAYRPSVRNKNSGI